MTPPVPGSATAHPASVSAIQLDCQPWIHSAASASFILRMFHCWMAGSAYAATTVVTSFACQGRRSSPLSVFSWGCGIAARAPGSTTGSTRGGMDLNHDAQDADNERCEVVMPIVLAIRGPSG